MLAGWSKVLGLEVRYIQIALCRGLPQYICTGCTLKLVTEDSAPWRVMVPVPQADCSEKLKLM